VSGPTRPLIIGGGLAGAAVAATLAHRGIASRVIADEAPTAGSAVPGAVLTPPVLPATDPLSRLRRMGRRITARWMHTLAASGLDNGHVADGVIVVPRRPRERARRDRIPPGPRGAARLAPMEAAARAGCQPPEAAIFHPAGACVVPARLSNAMLRYGQSHAEWTSAHVERIDVAGCESLNAVEGAGNCRRLTLARCPRIQRISVSGQVARLDHCATEREPLAVAGSWSRLVVLGTHAPGLDAPGVGHLFLRDSPAIRHASLGAFTGLTLKGGSRLSTDHPGQAARLDEQAVSGLLERAAEGEAAAERMLHEWCGQAVGPREMLDTLRALARFAERHAAPELLWTLRCELAAANRKKAAHAGVSPGEAVAAAQRHWHWRFPADLEQEGWEADVRLWVACRGWAPVQRCGRLLVRDRRLVPVVALIGCLGERPWDDDLRTLLLRALSYRYRHLCWGTDAEHRAQLGRLVQAALTLRDTAVAQGVANLVVCMLAPDACLRLLGPLVSAGHGGARALAMSFTRAGGGAEPDMRARAMAVALAPARSELFDTGEGNHGD
jgi:hypothetical protein